jgi:hypothetical protein
MALTVWPALIVVEDGEREIEKSAPVPESAAVCGLPAALSVTLRVPVREPAAVGLKPTLMLQLAPAATLVPQLFVAAKSPLAAMPEIVKAEPPVFARVIVCDVLVVPTVWLAKLKLVGVSLATGASGGGLEPVPDKATL